MKVKIQKWLKETITKLKDPMWWIDRLYAVSIYAIGFIFGAVYEKLKLHLFTRFTYHGEDFNLKDGDFLAYDTKRKTWDMFHNNKD